MIDFNQTDFNLTKIRHETKLANLITRKKYRIYGLRQRDNPPILVEFNAETVESEFVKRLSTLVKYFKSNGIEIETFDENDSGQIDIGLRKDIRGIVNKHEQPLFVSSILSTIVYCLEGRIDLDKMSKYKLTNIPKVPARVNEEENT